MSAIRLKGKEDKFTTAAGIQLHREITDFLAGKEPNPDFAQYYPLLAKALENGIPEIDAEASTNEIALLVTYIGAYSADTSSLWLEIVADQIGYVGADKARGYLLGLAALAIQFEQERLSEKGGSTPGKLAYLQAWTDGLVSVLVSAADLNLVVDPTDPDIESEDGSDSSFANLYSDVAAEFACLDLGPVDANFAPIIDEIHLEALRTMLKSYNGYLICQTSKNEPPVASLLLDTTIQQVAVCVLLHKPTYALVDVALSM